MHQSFGLRARFLTATALGAVLFAAPAFAQADGPIDYVRITAPRINSLNLATVSQTGSRLGLTPLETPASVQIISGDDIRLKGDLTVMDAQTRAVGLSASAAPGNGNAAIAARGFVGVTSVMNLYDGAQLFVGSGTVTFPFDPWTVERIEILSGPGSVLYGTGAIGGVVNVVPRKPDPEKASHEARISGGSYNTYRAAMDSTGPLGDGFSYRADASLISSGGWVDDGASSSQAYSGGLRYDANPQLSFTLTGDYARQHLTHYFGTPVVAGAIASGTRFNNYNVANATINFEDGRTNLTTEYRPSSVLSFRNMAHAMTTTRHWQNVENYAYAPLTGLVNRSSYIEVYHHQSQYGDHGDVTWSGDIAGRANTLVAGVDLNTVRFESTSNTPFGGTSTVSLLTPVPGNFINLVGTLPRFVTKTNAYAFFAEDRLKVTDEFSLVAGIRNDNYSLSRLDRVTNVVNANDYTTLSWRVGAVYALTPLLSLYAQYANATDPVSSLITLSPAQQGYDLTTGKQIEAGVKQSFWEGRGEWTLAAYQIVKKKLLAPDPVTPTLVVQIGQQSSQGVEASLSVDLGSGVKLQANGAWLDAEFDDFAEVVAGVRTIRDGNTPTNVPERVANLWASWDFLSDWQVQGGLRYVGSRFANNANTVKFPDFTVVDAGLRWSVTEKLAVDVKLYNAFDKIYPGSSANNGVQWILGRPRSVELSVSAKF